MARELREEERPARRRPTAPARYRRRGWEGRRPDAAAARVTGAAAASVHAALLVAEEEEEEHDDDATEEDEACASQREFFSRDATFPRPVIAARCLSFVSYRSPDGPETAYLPSRFDYKHFQYSTTSMTRRLLHSPRRALARTAHDPRAPASAARASL